jgi:hypothetical protein
MLPSVALLEIFSGISMGGEDMKLSACGAALPVISVNKFG